MQHTQETPAGYGEKINNLKAIFDILAYLQVDAKQDGLAELSDRLEFAMNCAEQQLSFLKTEISSGVHPTARDN